MDGQAEVQMEKTQYMSPSMAYKKKNKNKKNKNTINQTSDLKGASFCCSNNRGATCMSIVEKHPVRGQPSALPPFFYYFSHAF